MEKISERAKGRKSRDVQVKQVAERERERNRGRERNCTIFSLISERERERAPPFARDVILRWP